ncbi:hypothetical protein QLX08_009792 [Tetragonisca angustula]|uniref:Uncharacterized protein n=1 Tax=Tetragonisca angustula TaxID=166442 RepID=A0AAW0ZEQ4_9HYME
MGQTGSHRRQLTRVNNGSRSERSRRYDSTNSQLEVLPLISGLDNPSNRTASPVVSSLCIPLGSSQRQVDNVLDSFANCHKDSINPFRGRKQLGGMYAAWTAWTGSYKYAKHARSSKEQTSKSNRLRGD